MQVKIDRIDNRSKTALIRFDGRRCQVPTHILEKISDVDGVIRDELLSLAIPYGVDWDIVLQDVQNGNVLAEELKRLDVWTIEEIRKNVGKVSSLVREYGFDFQSFMILVESGGN